MLILNEALSTRPKLLKEVELLIDLLKKDYKNKSIILDIENKLQKFSQVNKIKFIIKPGLNNAYVITEYNNTFERILKTIIYPTNNDTNISSKIKTSDDIIQYIDTIYIIFGTKLLKECTNKEVVAIILHEFGHVFGHTSYIFKLAAIINNILRKIILQLKQFAIFPFLGLIVFAIIILTKSLSFLEHINEYNADEFAIKYGYGDEMAAIIIKWKNQEEKKFKINEFLKWLIKLTIPGSTHPSNEKRICNLKNKLLNDYTKQYAPINNELNILFKDLKC